MFVGRYEISISVTVEHVQHVGIIIVFLPGERVRFSVPGGTEKIAGMWFGRGIITQADTMMPFIWAVSLVGLMVVFGREIMALVSSEVFSKITAIWRQLYCHINPFPTPVENGF